ncbi:glycoside hydrolase family 32 protein [Paenibacillus albus]|uniref:beta-fructofuranosidase n=1 Tax=Paenibacillus albus TaxID=2495582 RepID=A0A3S9AB79_9BACL|nr:glycoside hydrolase family 32 protein [Paenibacillus albus]AZN42965.1 glycoside hydrolase family 32 protein [Paenibacillus albus]
MDRYKPKYHFTPTRNWMNDPNGPFQLNGEYHLFYQHNPDVPEWGQIHWGHAKSLDLVNWEHLPIALAPSRDLGEHHCYSGCAVVDGEDVRLFYTSIGEGERNATSGAEQWTVKQTSDDLLSWTKPDINPVLTNELHGDLKITEWRDPYVWKEQDGWKMLTGGIHEDKGVALIYHSDNLEEWRFERIYYKGEEGIFECPHIFRFGDKAVLFYSPSAPGQYVTGPWSSEGLIEVEGRGTVDTGGWDGYYASTGFVDEAGRRILLGWMPECRGDNFPVELDWNGALALPRVVELKPSGRIAMTPVPELASLRGENAAWADVRITEEQPLNTGISSTAFECAIEIKKPAADAAQVLTISVLASSDGREHTDVRVDFAAGTITLDRSNSSLFSGVRKADMVSELNLQDGSESLQLRLFVDQSVVELFAGDEICMTARVYPSLEDSNGVRLQAGGEALISSLEIWEMQAANIG